MPFYGPRSRSGYKSRSSRYRSTFKSNRAKAVSKARGKTKRILKKPYVPRILKNTQSVAALSRSVQRLQRQQLGLYQKARHGYTAPSNDPDFEPAKPILFALNDFNENNTVWTCDAAGAEIVKGTFAEWQYPMGALEQHNYWEGTYNDKVSDIAYLPISTQLEFSFETIMSPTAQPIWVKIDIVRQKKFQYESTVHDLLLPNALIGLSQMCDPKAPNKYNKEYFDVIKTRWVKLTRESQTYDGVMTINRRTKLSMTFPNKLLKLDKSDGTETSDHTFLTNVPPKDIYWCVINCSDNAQLQTNVIRTVRWRDQHGVST